MIVSQLNDLEGDHIDMNPSQPILKYYRLVSPLPKEETLPASMAYENMLTLEKNITTISFVTWDVIFQYNMVG